MPSSIRPLAPPSSAKLPSGTPDPTTSSASPSTFFPPTPLDTTLLGPADGSSNRPQSPFRALSSSGMLKQRSTDGGFAPAEDGLSDPLLSSSSTAPSAGASSRPNASPLPPQSPLDGPGTPGGGRRGTLSKGSRHPRGASWLPNGVGKAYPAQAEGELDDDDEAAGERDGLLASALHDVGVVAAQGLRVHVLDEDGEIARAEESQEGGDEEDAFGITIERPSTPQIASNSIFHRPAPAYGHRPAARASRWRLFRALKAKAELFALQTASLAISSVFLACVVVYALTQQFLFIRLPRLLRPAAPPSFDWEDPPRWVKEHIVNDPKYYARQIGFDLDEREVETEDGFLLKLQRVVPPPLPPGAVQTRPPFPIFIMHGLFQSSGSFITSEERSLAFWLASRRQALPEGNGGYEYDVWLGNTRGVFGMGHRRLSRGDPRFWDWTIRELAIFDLPALVDEVRRLSGFDKIAFIGHSQGNGTAFVSLSRGIRPDLGSKLSVFVALAPAVFAGPLTHGFPFTALGRMEWKTWRRVFGVLDFIPIMTYAYDYAPQSVFAFLGYTMFAFLFAWTDTNWLARRKGKMFRFTPSPVSSASIFWWAGKGGFATRKCLFDVGLDRWFDERFPPLSIYYGGRDFLVLTEPLLERLEQQETDVDVIRVKKIDLSEHCDFYWAAEAVEWCYHDIVADIERTRPDREPASSTTINGHAGLADGPLL